MAGTIYSGTYTTGITLSNPATQNPATITATGYVGNTGVALYGKNGTAWTVSNYGTVEGTGSSGTGMELSFSGGEITNHGTIDGSGASGTGIVLLSGGTVTNGSGASPNALIEGGGIGVNAGGAARATIVNYGTIDGLGTSSGGIFLFSLSGGEIANGSSASTTALIEGEDNGVVAGKAAVTVANYGTIEGLGGIGIGLSGGTIANGSNASTTALIEGNGAGVLLGAAVAGTVANYGTIESLGTSGGASGAGIYSRSGGTIINGSVASTRALIEGVNAGVLSDGTATVSLTNFGTIMATSGASEGIQFSGGTITNGSSPSTTALIEGESGVFLNGTATGAVTNFGTITARNGAGIILPSGGKIANGSSTSTKALIAGSFDGVDVGGTVAGTRVGIGTVTNSGTIKATTREGVFLVAGGTVTNFGTITAAIYGVVDWKGAVINGSSASTRGLIEGVGGVFLDGTTIGGVTNFGTIKATAGRGIILNGGGSVTNYGTIENTSTIDSAVLFEAKGSVANGSRSATTALIEGYRGVQFTGAGAAGTVTNYGTMKATTKSGVALGAGGIVTNHGLITGGSYGIGFGTTASAATVVNAGTITGKVGFGVVVGNTAGNALVNAGLIDGTGGTAVAFGGGNDVLTVDPSAVFVGAVKGGGGADKVIEGAAGLLKVTGFSGFETIVLANGGADTLTLTNANFAGVSGTPPTITVDGGNAGNTVVASGLTGANRIVAVGGAGIDRFTGGAGNDVFHFSAVNLAGGDIVKGGGGIDTLVMTSAGVVHAGGVSGVEIYRLANGGPNTLTLTANNFIGVSAPSVAPTSRPTITVFGGNDGNTVSAVAEPAGDQAVIHGGAGNDVFHAGGDTVMTGGLGANRFWFSSPGSSTITDFAASAANTIVLSNTGFSLGLSGFGPLPAGLFVKNPTGAFTASPQRFAYDTTNGELFYSASGSTASEHLVTTLAGHPALAVSQLFHG